MTVASQTRTAGPYVGTGLVSAYPFAFKVFADTDLRVTITTSAGVVTTAVLGPDFSVTLNSDQNAAPGGTITLTTALQTGSTLMATSSLTVTQGVSIQNGGAFYPKVIEDALDRLTILMQEHGFVGGPQMLRVPEIGGVPALPSAVQRANTQLLFDSSGNPYVASPASGSAADLALNLLSTTVGKGASMVALLGSGTAQDAIDAYTYAGSGSDDTAALIARDTLAAAAGRSLILSGAITISSAITFASVVRPSPGCRITTSGVGGGTKYLKFGGGVFAGLQYWLDTDWPTQFLNTAAIFPQWFGSCGGASEDSSVPMVRAFRACRAGFSAASDYTDKTMGCRLVWFTSGTYKCANVPVYAGTNIDGDWGGSPYGATIAQIDYNNPGLRFIPKNYSLTDGVLNNSVGQNHIDNIRICCLVPSSSFDGEPACKFMSPTQATTYLGITGDSVGLVGHIDTQFNSVWFKGCGVAIGADDGMLWVHVARCTFDVVYKAIQHSGTAYGMVRSYNNVYYGCLHGAVHNTSSVSTVGVKWDFNGDEFKSGGCYHSTADWRRALNYNPTTVVAGTFVKIKGCHFLKNTSLGGTAAGTSTGGNSTSTLIDTSKAWTTNAWAGSKVYITGGTGNGQSRTVLTNTATTLTISGTWMTTPDATSTYYVEALRIGGPIFIKNCERLTADVEMMDPDSANNQHAIAIQDGVSYVDLRGQIVSVLQSDYTTGALVKITQPTQAIKGGAIAMTITNAGTVASQPALDSDYAVDSKLRISGTNVNGPFTAAIGNNLSQAGGRVLTGSASCAFGTVANATRSSAFNVTVVGASVGDMVIVAPGGSMAGCQYDGYVSATNNVVLYAYNGTGSSQTIGTITMTAYVTRASGG